MKRVFFLSFLIFNLQFSIFNCTFAQRYELNKKDTSEVKWVSGKKFYEIKADKKETIYSICKRFNVPQDTLVRYNPELKNGLKAKMKILVPAPSAFKVAPTPEVKIEKKPVKKLFNITVMLPVNAWRNFIPDSATSDSLGNDRVNDESNAQLEFYEGIGYVIDSLSSKDFKFHVRLFDTSNDTSEINKFLKDPFLKESDYIVVNGSSTILRQLSRFSLQYQIPLITFSLNASSALKNNPHAYAFTPSSNTQCIEAGKFFASKFKIENTLIVTSGLPKEKERAESFMKGWNSFEEAKAKMVDYSKENFEELLRSLVKWKNNVLFVPSSNEDFVSTLLRNLNDTADVYPVTIIGIPTWQYFESIDPAIMEKLNTHLFLASSINEDNAQAIQFRKYFRTEYMCEPDENALQGYDVMTFIGSKCKLPSKEQDKNQFEGLYTTYDFVTEDGMNENKKIHFLKYQNFQLLEVK